jgi:hypothetical protein
MLDRDALPTPGTGLDPAAEQSLVEGSGPADLHPDLEEWLDPPGDEFRFIRHPLLVTLYKPALTANTNHDFEQKVRSVEVANQAEDWDQYVWLHEKPYRAEALYDVAYLLDDGDYWELVSAVWIHSENIWECEDEWRALLSADRPHRELLMSEEERSFLADLSIPVEIYRGYDRTGRERGFSWTLDRSRAELFAQRSDEGVPRLAVGFTRNPIAYLNARSEQELIVFPEDVTGIAVETLARSERWREPEASSTVSTLAP